MNLTELDQLPLPGIEPDVHKAAFMAMRARVFAAEAQMLQLPQVELPVKDYFSYGVYARELFIPKGVMLTGKIHKYENLNIISQGELLVLVDDEIKRLCAPFTIVSPAGTKRIAYAIQDTVWTTIHGTYETNLDEIEKFFIAQNEDNYLTFVEQQKLIGLA